MKSKSTHIQKYPRNTFVIKDEKLKIKIQTIDDSTSFQFLKPRKSRLFRSDNLKDANMTFANKIEVILLLNLSNRLY